MKKLFFLAIAITTFLSCKKEPGPQGPAGNANVHTQNFNVTNSLWLYAASSNQWYYNADCSLITSTVISYGTVQVYATTDAATFTAMPFTDYNTSGSISCNYAIQQGKISFLVDGNYNLSSSFPGATTFKVVAIDGTARKMLQQKGISMADYPSVKKALNLGD